MKLVSKPSDRSPGRKLRLQLGLALALSTGAFGADAAGLGRLSVLSSLGQPLRAEIEVTSIARDEAGSLSARLASADAFSQANLEYGAMLSGLRFSVQRRPSGQAYVLVTSSQLVNEPFLDMLVELSWASGRLVREYTVLIDPPELRDPRSVEPGQIVAAQAPTAVTRAAPSRPAAAAPSTSSTGTTPTTSTAPARASAAGDYTVQTGDTAMSIARRNRPDGVSLDQVLAALYRDNPQAFGGNIDVLRAGAQLKLPDAAAAQAIGDGEARRVIASSSNFGSYRDRIARSAVQTTRTPDSRRPAS